ncbi:MAG: hypothetical protein ABI664_01495 [bacterium]
MPPETALSDAPVELVRTTTKRHAEGEHGMFGMVTALVVAK